MTVSSIQTFLSQIASLAGNDLLVRRWASMATSPHLTELARNVVEAQADLTAARAALWHAVKSHVQPIVIMALSNSTPDALSTSMEDTLVDLVVTQMIEWQRMLREETVVRRKLVVQPIDGGPLDQEHLDIVAGMTASGVDSAEAWKTAWQHAVEKLALCERPAHAWVPEHEIQVEISEKSADESDDEEESEEASGGEGRPSCARCEPLGPAYDEDGHPCLLYFCKCSNDGTILVAGAMGVRAVPLAVVLDANQGSPAPQVEGLRRARAAGLVKDPP